MAGPSLAGDGVDDEPVARAVGRDGGEHRRVVLGAGVRVREVGLDAADLGHRQHARSDQLLVRDDDERRPEEEVEQRGESVLALGGRGEPEAVARRAAVDHGVEGAGRDVMGLVEDEQPEPAEERVELRRLPANERLDDGDRDGRDLLLAVADEAGLDAQLVAQLAEPLLREVERVDEDERRRAEPRDGAHAHAGLPAAARDDDGALRDLRELVDRRLLVPAERQLAQGVELRLRQHALVVAGDDEPLLRSGSAQHMDGPAGQPQLAAQLLHEAHRLELGAGVKPETQAIQVRRVRERERAAQALDHLRRHVARVEGERRINSRAHRRPPRGSGRCSRPAAWRASVAGSSGTSCRSPSRRGACRESRRRRRRSCNG